MAQMPAESRRRRFIAHRLRLGSTVVSVHAALLAMPKRDLSAGGLRDALDFAENSLCVPTLIPAERDAHFRIAALLRPGAEPGAKGPVFANRRRARWASCVARISCP